MSLAKMFQHLLQNFIVLGQVPGTNVTITFQMWIEISLVLAGLILFWLGIYRRHLLGRWLLNKVLSAILEQSRLHQI